MASVVKRCQHASQNRCQCNWVVRYRDALGKQREESFLHDQRQVALDRKLKIEHDLRAGTPVFSRRSNNEVLGEFIARWITQHSGSPKTKRNYRSALAQHIGPALGHVALHRVTREAVRQLLLETMPQSVGHDAIVTSRTVLVSALNEALRQHKIDENPSLGIRLPKRNQRAEFTIASYDQLTTLANALPSEWRTAVWLMRGCGLRIGEALAVRSECVRGEMLRTEEQVLETGELGPLKHRDPGEFRDVPLPQYVAKMITGTGYVFPEFTSGAVLSWRFRDSWHAGASAAGLPPTFTPHDLRHTWASIALASGIPITDVSRWLGHRNINTTYSIYGHLVPETTQRATLAIDAEYASWSARAKTR
jgi:integrase